MCVCVFVCGKLAPRLVKLKRRLVNAYDSCKTDMLTRYHGKQNPVLRNNHKLTSGSIKSIVLKNEHRLESVNTAQQWRN